MKVALGVRSPVSQNAVIVGGGRVGRHTAEQLVDHEYTVTVVEFDPETSSRLASGRIEVIEGDGTDIEVLERAGIAEADVAAALTDDTQANIVVCGLARELNPDVRTLARVSEDGEQDYGHLSDVDNIVYPAAAGADVTTDRLLSE